jgi:ATP-dependent protease ClpP protease subunit
MHKILQLIKDNKNVAQPLNLVSNEGEASLYIYDIIDAYWGVSAQQVATALSAVKDTPILNVYINSPGGSVFESKAIMSELQRFAGTKIAHIDSLCASAATSIALACNEIRMNEGAFFMIHNASTYAFGDKTDLRNTADLLEKIEGSIVADYVNKTGKSEDEIRTKMDAETWFTAQEALENGFIDATIPAPTAKNQTTTWNLAAFEKAPASYQASNQTKTSETEPNQSQNDGPAGLFMSQSNTNKLQLLTLL